MWLKKVKHKKLQMFMVGLVLFITAGLFNMCLCFTQELSSFSKRGINTENTPDAYLLTTGTHTFEDYFTSSDDLAQIKQVTGLYGKTVSVPIKHGKSDISMYYDMVLEGKGYKEWQYMELVDGDTSNDGPAEGEVWISETLAVPNNIHIGDTITLQYDEPMNLTVAATYRTSCFPKAVGFSPMLVSEADIGKVQNEQDSAFFAVNLYDYTESQADALFRNSEYCTSLRTREDVQANMVEFSSMFGSIGIVAALVVFAVALAILRFIIKSNLLKEFRTIGIYKSLGYTSRQIEGFYMKGYMLVGIIAIALGTLLSLFAVQMFGTMVTKFVDGFGLSSTSVITTIISIVALMLLLFINVKVGLKKVKKITPVEAITIGLTSAETKLKPSVIKNAKTSFEMAINEIFKYKKSTAMITLVLTVSMYLSMLFVMIWYSSYKMTDNSNLWFCLPMNDTYIAGDISDELMQYLNNECEFLKSVVAGDFSYKEEATVDDYPEIQGTIRYDSYTDFTKSITGINILEGRAPEGNDEIVAGLGLLSKTKLKIGDTIRLTINDVTREYTITGSYDTVADNSVKFMLTTEALKESVKDYAYTRAYVRLNKDSDFNAFKQDVESKFTGVIVDKKWFALENSVESIRQMLEAISAVLVFIFIMFSMLNIIIVSLMENKKKYRSFGIMKSLGFTTRYIVNQNLWKYFIISIFGSIISLGLQLLVSRKLVAMMLVDAFVNPIMLLVLLLVGFIVLILGSTLLINRSIKKISPVELMEE